MLLLAFTYALVNRILRQREEAQARRLWNEGLQPLMASLWEAADRLRLAVRMATKDDQYAPEVEMEYRHYADFARSLQAAFVATPHLVRFVALTSDFGSRAWSATHAPVPWLQAIYLGRFEEADKALFDAFDAEGIMGPEPRLPLGMAMQTQRQIDEDEGRRVGL